VTRTTAPPSGSGGSLDLPAALNDFYGPNAGYVLELFERYRADPASVAPEVRAFFERWQPPPAAPEAAPAAARPVPAAQPVVEEDVALVAAVGKLATAIRERGHRAAHLNPLAEHGRHEPELDLAAHGLTEEELEHLPASAVGGPAAEGAPNARVALERLRRIYCSTTGYDFDHVQDATERAWLREAAESERFRPPNDPINELALLERLSEVGAFERFLHRTFPGQTRFSIEGTGMLIPMLDEIIGAAAEAGTRSVLIGMAHRGRLNVLAHVLGKPHIEILREFKNLVARPGISRTGSSGEAFSGDVKYHLGARRAVPAGEQVEMSVTLAPNPSHLEFVNPVIEGMARAAGEQRDRRGRPEHNEWCALPLLIHGDASFPGEGIVAETLNLSRLPGYRTGGTIHIIINNQLGFTTEPEDGRSTLYASDLAKGFEIPVVHVNADDVVACIAAARLAHAYREEFRKDFLIDLIGYRRWGHNEGEEPSFTQPLMYAKIAKHPTVRELWAAELVRRGVVTEAEVAARLAAHINALQEALAQVNAEAAAQEQAPPQPAQEAQEQAQSPEADGRSASPPEVSVEPPEAAELPRVITGVALGELEDLNRALYTLPPEFTLHPKLERPMRRRREAFNAVGGRPAGEPGDAGRRAAIEWGHAEALAFATILAEGTPIRLSGQDSVAGTFSQRHAALFDYQTGRPYVPLQHLPQARASFEIWNSPLSEAAVLGFEYGYNVQAAEALVLWEAQYGDFVNAAQVIVDQFVMSARAKWGQEPSLVLLLPHGYEGQGPEHSSARLERFLQQAAEDNVRVANCTTAAQYFHLLRRQAALLRTRPRPLIALTPKSLLRHPLAASLPEELGEGTAFEPVLDDPALAPEQRAAVQRIIVCSGKVYVDLATSAQRSRAAALIRLEELYPFPARALAQVLAGYPQAREVVWVQEEPQNMGAWFFVAPRLEALAGARGLRVRYVGRPEAASPAEGTYAWHLAAQRRLIAEAFEGLPTEEHAAPARLGAPAPAAAP
jgi:2-oxoglutarate dehydrogenase E1 component